MTDIVERLRACPGIQSGDPDCCCQEAAAEVEQLRAALAIEGLSCKVAADIERQQAEIERLKAQNDMIATDAVALTQAVDALAIQSKKLRNQLTHAAGFIEGMATRMERWRPVAQDQDVEAAANALQVYAKSLRKLVGIRTEKELE